MIEWQKTQLGAVTRPSDVSRGVIRKRKKNAMLATTCVGWWFLRFRRTTFSKVGKEEDKEGKEGDMEGM